MYVVKFMPSCKLRDKGRKSKNTYSTKRLSNSTYSIKRILNFALKIAYHQESISMKSIPTEPKFYIVKLEYTEAKT